MYKLFMKEIRISSHPLSFFFIIFSFMFLVPGYPILCAPFFVTLGLFQSFQKARENGDILFSVLLPIKKADTVKGKFIFTLSIELASTLLMALCVILRGTVLRDNPIYSSSPMMKADLFTLTLAVFIFALFNCIFVRGFFLTAYKLGLPFLLYAISAFIVAATSEVLSHFFSVDSLYTQAALFAVGLFLFSLSTVFSYRMSVKSFERVDL